MMRMFINIDPMRQGSSFVDMGGSAGSLGRVASLGYARILILGMLALCPYIKLTHEFGTCMEKIKKEMNSVQLHHLVEWWWCPSHSCNIADGGVQQQTNKSFTQSCHDYKILMMMMKLLISDNFSLLFKVIYICMKIEI